MAPADDKGLKESPETSVVRLEGCWSVERARELKQVLTEALKSADRIVLDLQYLAEADLSCLQLLCSAHGASFRLGKTLALHEKKSESFKRVVRDSGFKRNMGCDKAPGAHCLWIGEWES